MTPPFLYVIVYNHICFCIDRAALIHAPFCYTIYQQKDEGKDSMTDVADAGASEQREKDQIERYIFKSRRKELWTPFLHAIQDFRLISEGDRIAVCVSGGKDSWLMAALFQALARVTAIPFSAAYVCMDPGYSAQERVAIADTAARLGIDLRVFQTDVFEQVRGVQKGQCYLCARMRRGHLYKEAREIGCNKIALAHHYNDVVETILMGTLYGAQTQTMMPKLFSKNFPGMELIRPLYYTREKDITAFRDRHGIRAISCGCPFLKDRERDTCGGAPGARERVKRLVAQLKETHPQIEDCVFKSVQNVNLNTIISYRKDGVYTSFLDNYDSVQNCIKEDESHD